MYHHVDAVAGRRTARNTCCPRSHFWGHVSTHCSIKKYSEIWLCVRWRMCPNTKKGLCGSSDAGCGYHYCSNLLRVTFNVKSKMDRYRPLLKPKMKAENTRIIRSSDWERAYVLFDVELFSTVNARIRRDVQRYQRVLDVCRLMTQLQKRDRLAKSWNRLHSWTHTRRYTC